MAAERQAAARARSERPRMWQRQRAGWRGREGFRRFASLKRARAVGPSSQDPPSRRWQVGLWRVGREEPPPISLGSGGAAHRPSTVPTARTRRGVRGMDRLRCEWLRAGGAAFLARNSSPPTSTSCVDTGGGSRGWVAAAWRRALVVWGLRDPDAPPSGWGPEGGGGETPRRGAYELFRRGVKGAGGGRVVRGPPRATSPNSCATQFLRAVTAVL